MTNNISLFTRKQNIKNIIDKIITKPFDIILYPLRYFYKHKYNGSDFQTKRRIKKAYKKLKNNIYRVLLDEGEVFITDFYVGQEYGCYNIISIGEQYALLCNTDNSVKGTKVIFNEIEDILRADESLMVDSIGVRDLFKYGYFKEDGRVIKVSMKIWI